MCGDTEVFLHSMETWRHSDDMSCKGEEVEKKVG